MRGVLKVVEGDHWVAAVADNWWAANRALSALAPRFAAPVGGASDYSIRSALDAALNGDGVRIGAAGDVGAAFRGVQVVSAEYRAAPALHAAIEPRTATAASSDGAVELWLPTLAPGLARSAVAAAMGVGEDAVIVHPMPIGGGFGIGLESDAGVQAAAIARAVDRPVQLTWSRAEDCVHDRFRAPAAARMTGRVDQNGRLVGLLAKIAAPSTGHELASRLLASDKAAQAALALPANGDAYAVAGGTPFYQIPNWALDHHPADVGIPTGHWRSGAHSYTCFFTECFIDELAHAANTEPLSFRVSMLGGNARLARCLTTVAALGGWEGGVEGSGQGSPVTAFAAVISRCSRKRISRRISRSGSTASSPRSIAGDRSIPISFARISKAGWYSASPEALGASTRFKDGLATVRGFGDLDLPVLADMPDITVELIASEADPGGVSELAVPPVAPAIANALQSATGFRIRSLPLKVGEA